MPNSLKLTPLEARAFSSGIEIAKDLLVRLERDVPTRTMQACGIVVGLACADPEEAPEVLEKVSTVLINARSALNNGNGGL